VEGVELTDEQIEKLALIAPRATIVIIRSYRVAEKKNAVPPNVVTGILNCTGATCISVREKDSVQSMFTLATLSPLSYRCKFCGRVLTEQEISSQLG
jgi:aspartate carbamoyltransferase regulatory subunit